MQPTVAIGTGFAQEPLKGRNLPLDQIVMMPRIVDKRRISPQRKNRLALAHHCELPIIREAAIEDNK